jgi:hypothetical protein
MIATFIIHYFGSQAVRGLGTARNGDPQHVNPQLPRTTYWEFGGAKEISRQLSVGWWLAMWPTFSRLTVGPEPQSRKRSLWTPLPNLRERPSDPDPRHSGEDGVSGR